MSAHLSIGKNSYVVLMRKILDAAQAYDLAVILPGDKVIGKALADQIMYKVLERNARRNMPQGKILAALVRINAERVGADAKYARRAAQQRMKGGVRAPKDVLGAIAQAGRIAHF